MKPVSLQLDGAIRPAINGRCVGVALFRRGGGNLRYVGECDRFLRIARFVEFEDFDGYQIDYALPEGWRGATYAIGDPLPLPFWQKEGLEIVAGDMSPLEFVLEKRSDDVRDRVMSILKKGSEGSLVGEGELTEEALFEEAFQDILEEEPAHSQYWIARYDLAARQMKDAPYPLRSKLRERKSLWLDRYARKADLTKVGGLIAWGENYEISDDDRDLIYAVVVDRLSKMKHDHLAWAVNNPLFQTNFPEGVVGHYERRGWPRQRYKLLVPEQFHAPMLQAIQAADEYENNENEWARAEVVAFVMYGQTPLPVAFEEMMLHIIRDREEDLYGRLNSFWPLSRYQAEGRRVPVEILNRYIAYLRMQRVLKGGDRMESFPKGIDLNDIAGQVNYHWKAM